MRSAGPAMCRWRPRPCSSPFAIRASPRPSSAPVVRSDLPRRSSWRASPYPTISGPSSTRSASTPLTRKPIAGNNDVWSGAMLVGGFMSLSVCILTRDAEGRIERALRSVAPLGAHVLVGDTGSHDRTVEVARSLGAQVIDIPWRDDFSDAQNLTLDAAGGDWIFWINPDEELMAPGVERLPQLLAEP